MNKSLFKVFSLITILALMLMAVPVQSVQAASTTIMISEFRTRGPNGGNDEFIELYNLSTSPVNIGGWKIKGSNNTGGGTTTPRATIPANTILNPGCYYLLTNSTSPSYSGSVPGNQTYGTGVTDDGGIAVTTGSDIIVDQVGMHTGSAFKEGSILTPLTTNVNRGYERKPGGTSGNGTDTDNNSSDFQLLTPSNPQNTSSPCQGGDAAPSVSSTVPANNAIDVARATNITVTFSESVTVNPASISISCTASGLHTFSFSGGPKTFTLNPDADFAANETCTVTIPKTSVSDQDANDPPDNMQFDFSTGFTTIDLQVCGDPAKFIHEIQGPGLISPYENATNISIEGIVTADYQGPGQFSGYYLQEEDAQVDANPSTSEGIFVFNTSFAVNVGDKVRVKGTVTEFNGLTEITPVSTLLCSTGNALPATTSVNLPVTSLDDFETYEGMQVIFPQALVIAEYFNYDRFGEMVLALPLAGETRPFTGTAIDEPGDDANARTLANSLRRITLDDGLNTQNPSTLRHPNGNPFSLSNRFRGGDTVQNTVGILTFGFDLYRIQPTAGAQYTSVNPRPAAPEAVGGSLRVAAMNTLNYFVTADYPTGNPLDNKCGPLNTVECRGWDSDQSDEFTRQRTKLLQALTGLDADIIGLNELENSTGVEPLADIVAGLNDLLGAETYSYINTGTIGTDAIKVGIIYRPAEASPVGTFKLLTSAIDPRFIDTKSRPSLAQTFIVNATGARFTVVVNHFKSKGSACDDLIPPDPDLGDGQGNCSQTRRAAAEALVDWLATDPTGSGDPDFIIMGDLNSYAQEDTIDEIKAGSDDTVGTSDDFTNLISHFQGAYAYSYTFDGQAGYLDHALANASLLAQTSGAADWHINSDEPDVLDYDTSFKPPSQDALYETNAYRTSDHDPVVVGLDLVNYPPELGDISVSSSLVPVGTTVNASVSFTDPDKLDIHTAAWDWGDGTTTTGTVTDSNGTGTINDSHVYITPGVYTVTVTVDDGYGNTDQATYEFVVVYDPNGGFVTGGGWIDSPAGAYAADPSLAGKASFGFVAKYQKGANVPDGNTQFQFKAGDLNFHSASYEWLVVAGSKAQFKGEGTINGEGSYKFMITADDGNPDAFRIKIWYEDGSGEHVVYDNGSQQPLGGGSIVIHK